MPSEDFEVTNETRGTRIALRVRPATNSKVRRKGLLGMAEMPGDFGLWIAPCEAVHTFWMQFPIDIIFLNRKKEVVKLSRHVRPWRIAGSLRAYSLLELKAGTIDRSRTQVFDSLRFHTP